MGGSRGSGWGDRPSPETYESKTLFTMIFHNAEISVRDVRPFCRPLFYYSSVVEVYFFPLTIAKPL